MEGCQQGQAFWADPNFYPVEQRLLQGFPAKETQVPLPSERPVLLVDVGGSMGHDLKRFIEVHPTAPGRFILQDLPQVIEKVAIQDMRIEAVPHDFHNPQPVRGEPQNPLARLKLTRFDRRTCILHAFHTT